MISSRKMLCLMIPNENQRERDFGKPLPCRRTEQMKPFAYFPCTIRKDAEKVSLPFSMAWDLFAGGGGTVVVSLSKFSS